MAGTPARRAPYKDTLQPALHRRFSSTAILLLAVSYLEALLLASWSSCEQSTQPRLSQLRNRHALTPTPLDFWSWFPIGPAGVRTAIIFTCGLSILILRIAHYHVGLKTTESGLQTLSASLLNLQTYETGFWYGISSLLFCPVFLFSMSDTSNLRWITYFSGDRARLNERPLFLACYLGTCALLQTMAHYRLDIDRLDLSLPKPKAGEQNKKLAVLPRSFQNVLVQLPAVFAGCIKQAVSALFLALVLYYVFLRSFAWGWALGFLRPFYNLPKTSILPPSWPSDVYLLARCIYAGTLVNFVWSAGNTAFSIFMVKEPLKNGKPLTSESKDANGTRRQAIYCDIDRKDGPMWAQVYAICMEVLKSIESRVDEYGKPAVAAAPEPAATVPKQRVFAPLRQDSIFYHQGHTTGLKGGVEAAWDQLARAPGATPVSELSPLAKKTWKGAKDRMLSKEQQEALSPDRLRGEFEQWTASVMKIELVGALFRHDFRTRFAAAVLGTPYAEPALYVNTAQALCQLSVHSLAEDQFGNVHRDVASIVRTLTAVIRKVEALKVRFPSHWTDPTGVKESPEVDQILDVLRTGLEQVVAKFEPYSSDLRLSLGELRMAKEAAAKPEEPAPRAQDAMGKPKSVEEEKTESRRAQRREQQRIEMEQVR
ncbi:hypothetical protein TOPH_01304 [Tolypocladium ophioglossoides CBS 100239]|uniref:Nucleoporin NDC1 n=1 Tax=Tolypocladium ophioglossoides (strain CBS 100239) TaxID=1163406 RepID=A0A0L0NKI7_TOLOC|nr:hypothetical protein TOPH_01304 [Tolypocladium ophioglossoides CBS 100239]